MPSTCLPVSEPLMSSHPSPEEDIRAQTYLAPSTGTSSIGFELAWSSPFFFIAAVIWGFCLEQVLVTPLSLLAVLDSIFSVRSSLDVV